MKLIITGATGMVGEGVLLTCLNHPEVQEVLIVNRKHAAIQHPKLTELIVPDFLKLEAFTQQLTGYDACFYCAGISSFRMKEADYALITYATAIHFAKTLLQLNPDITFDHISGGHTDSSEKGKVMWARVKGKAENELIKMGFKKIYNFRPGMMKPVPGQKNINGFYKIITGLYPFFKLIFPNQVLTLQEVGLAMIKSVFKGYDKQVLEVKDIKLLAGA